MIDLNKLINKVDKLDYRDFEVVELIQFTHHDKQKVIDNIHNTIIFTVKHINDLFIRFLFVNGKIESDEIKEMELIPIHYSSYQRNPEIKDIKINKIDKLITHELIINNIKINYSFYENKKVVEYNTFMHVNEEESRIEITTQVRYNVIPRSIEIHGTQSCD